MALKLQEIARLTPLEADRLRGRAVEGDTSAARDYVLYAAWRDIDRKDLTPKDKARTLRALSEKLGDVQIQTVPTHG